MYLYPISQVLVLMLHFQPRYEHRRVITLITDWNTVLRHN